MKYVMLFAAILFPIHLPAQTLPPRVSTPQHIVVDSKDNVFATLKYGIVKITPDGTVTNITKEAGIIGALDRPWHNLIIDSKDNLYANDGNLIYKITVTADNKAIAKIHAGQQYTYKLEDGPISTAGFNMIDLMTIDKNDNIYLTDSYDKIKAAIGNNFIH
jgi:hypothetical protein